MTAERTSPRGNRAASTKGRSTHQHVMHTSIELFAEKGYAATSMRELARRAELPVSAYYYYYATKYDALIGIIESAMQDLVDHVGAAVDPTAPPPDRLRQMVAAHVDRHLADPLSAHVTDTEMRSLTEADRRRIIEIRKSYESGFRTALRDGLDSGDFSADLDVSFAVNLILTMATGVIYWFKPDGRRTRAEVAAGVAHHAVRLVS